MPGRPQKPVIGLTGGIGSGKSFVARQLAELGCAVIDSDELAGQALDDPHVRRLIAERWGGQVFGGDGRVDRAALARIVFPDTAQLQELERMVHPRVHELRGELRSRYQTDPTVRALVEDCPLLVENQLQDECDATVFVRADRGTRLRRVAERGWSDRDLAAREKNQLGLDIKAELADYVIANDADEAHCMAQVRGVLSQILSALPRRQ